MNTIESYSQLYKPDLKMPDAELLTPETSKDILQVEALMGEAYRNVTKFMEGLNRYKLYLINGKAGDAQNEIKNCITDVREVIENSLISWERLMDMEDDGAEAPPEIGDFI